MAGPCPRHPLTPWVCAATHTTNHPSALDPPYLLRFGWPRKDMLPFRQMGFRAFAQGEIPLNLPFPKGEVLALLLLIVILLCS